jgi:hypothetical protein
MFLKEFNKTIMYNLTNFMYTMVYIIIIIKIIKIILLIFSYLYFIVKSYLVNKPFTFLLVEGILTSNNCFDRIRIINPLGNRSEYEFMYMLEAALIILDSAYYKYTDQDFIFLLLFTDVGDNNVHNALSEPCIFKYNVNDPISVNELYNLFYFNNSTYKYYNRDIVLTIRKI